MLIKKIIIILIFFAILSPFETKAVSQLNGLNNYSIKIDKAVVKSGYTIDAFNSGFKIGIFPNILTESTEINLKNITELLNEETAGPNDMSPILQTADDWQFNSDIYEYDFLNKNGYDQQKPLIVEIGFGKDTDNYKKIFYFDDVAGEWKQLPSEINWKAKKIRTKINFNYVRLAIFDQVNVMGRGKSSWYNQSLFQYFKYKNGDFAASQQYPKGAKLKVTNLENDKFVIINVNDYGPMPWTGRIIDLDVSAFKKIANKKLGVINVVIKPVELQ